MFEGTDSFSFTLSQFSQTFLTGPSKLRTDLPIQDSYCGHRKFDSVNQS